MKILVWIVLFLVCCNVIALFVTYKDSSSPFPAYRSLSKKEKARLLYEEMMEFLYYTMKESNESRRE